jgi:hypothetical protein
MVNFLEELIDRAGERQFSPRELFLENRDKRRR